MIYVLTSHPGSAACSDLLGRARTLGIAMRAAGGQGPARLATGKASVRLREFAEQDVVFAYGAGRGLLAEVSGTKALVVNGTLYSKHDQYKLLSAAGIPVPPWQRVQGRVTAEQLSALSGPLILKPDFGGFGIGVRLLEGPAQLEAVDLRRPHIVQQYVPCKGRCARVVVLGNEVAGAIDRVARDGVVAAYRHGKAGWLEPIDLEDGERRLCVAAARTLGIEVAGVDLIRSDRGPFILEVNHRFVPFHMRAMYGDMMDRIARYLDARHRSRAPGCSRRRGAWKLPRIADWMQQTGVCARSTQQPESLKWQT